MNIREATLEDLTKVQKLNQLLFEKENNDYDSLLNTDWPFEEEGKEYFTKAINDPSWAVFVAEEDDKIVGYLAGSIRKEPLYKDHCLEAELENMLVLEECRGSGVGSKLVVMFKDWAKKSGAKRVEVRASHANDRGINFYKKNGFEDFDTVLKLDL